MAIYNTSESGLITALQSLLQEGEKSPNSDKMYRFDVDIFCYINMLYFYNDFVKLSINPTILVVNCSYFISLVWPDAFFFLAPVKSTFRSSLFCRVRQTSKHLLFYFEKSSKSFLKVNMRTLFNFWCYKNINESVI